MNASLDSSPSWEAVYELRDKFDQLIDSAYKVMAVGKSRMDAMSDAADKLLAQKPDAVKARCKSFRKL